MLEYQVFGEFSRKNAHSGTRGSKIRFRFLVRFQHLAEIGSGRFRFQKKRPKTVGSSVSVRTDPALAINSKNKSFVEMKFLVLIFDY